MENYCLQHKRAPRQHEIHLIMSQGLFYTVCPTAGHAAVFTGQHHVVSQKWVSYSTDANSTAACDGDCRDRMFVSSLWSYEPDKHDDMVKDAKSLLTENYFLYELDTKSLQ